MRNLDATSKTVRALSALVALALAGVLAGCGPSPNQSASHKSGQDGQRVTPIAVARHIAGVRMGALTGDQQAVRDHIDAMSKDMLHDARISDPSRPIVHEAARAAVAPLPGVRSVVWIDHDNLLVMVGGAQYRNMMMVDRVCDTLDPLGDTLAVVVNVQDVTATTSEGADAVSRNCQLPEGQSAFLRQNRRIEALDPALRKAFKALQHDPASR